ncbi:MAG: hypothetical protein JWQ04_775 [Pedosphaera sp.]|nr:hypothetical protein [Pedosphaera sp.]
MFGIPAILFMLKFHAILLKKSALSAHLQAVTSIALLAILAAGCSGRDAKHRGFVEEVIAPKPPAFFVGPASALLTNVFSFSAKLTLELPGDTNRLHAFSGQLLGQGSHLLFAPERNDRTFIWDVRDHGGYVLSEALQGYAPVTSPIQVTNLATAAEIAGPGSDRVNGHPGHEVEVNVASNDGSTARFSIWRAADLNGFPVRIKSLSDANPFIINLSDVRPATLSPSLFLPPDGFTKYSTPDSMAGELMVRKSKPKPSETPRLDEVVKPKPNYSH